MYQLHFLHILYMNLRPSFTVNVAEIARSVFRFLMLNNFVPKQKDGLHLRGVLNRLRYLS